MSVTLRTQSSLSLTLPCGVWLGRASLLTSQRRIFSSEKSQIVEISSLLWMKDAVGEFLLIRSTKEASEWTFSQSQKTMGNWEMFWYVNEARFFFAFCGFFFLLFTTFLLGENFESHKFTVHALNPSLNLSLPSSYLHDCHVYSLH